MPDTCADQLSTSLRRGSDIPPEYDAWSATALSPLSMHDAIPRRLKFPATSPASVSPADYIPQQFDIEIQHEERRPTRVLYEYAIR